MLRNPHFYIAVPEFAYLKENVDAATALAKQGGCNRCGGEWRHMQGVCDAAFLKLRELLDTQNQAIQRVKDWLSERKGYTVKTCVIYYRRSAQQKNADKLEF